jgi:hypothetical protein
VPEEFSDECSAGSEGRAYVMLVCFFFIYEYFFEPPNQKRTYAGVNFVYKHRA